MNTINKRIVFVNFLVIVSSFVILSRFFYIQIISHEKLKKYAENEYERKTTEIMPRGEIYDINGKLLASSIVKWDVVIMKKEFNKYEELDKLSKILSIPLKELKDKINKGKNYIKIKKLVEKDAYEQISSLNLKGVLLEPHQTRIYPTELAREIIGVSNENTGLTQTEAVMNDYLKGNIVTKEVIKDSKGNIIKTINEFSDKIPSKIYLTVEEEIQSFVESALEKYYADLNCKNIIILVQNIENGFLSALGAYPKDYVNLKPFEFVYEPGSTFKTIILSAGFEENKIEEDDYIDCEKGSWKVNQKHTITDHEPLGNTKLTEVYAHSSNIGFAKIGLKIGIEKLYPYIKKFGFDSKYTNFPGESKGIVKDFKKYKDIDVITTSYGYGIAVTPLQLINAYTSIANGGILLKPHVIYKIQDEKKEIEFKREEIRRTVSEQTARRVTEMMINVVEFGTGVNAQIPGYFVAGKTGTANKLDLKTGKYIKGENITSFCGFLPAKNPKYSILVIVDSSKKYKYGGQTAAPIFQEIARQIISLKNIKPEREIDYSKIKKKKSVEILN